MTDFPTFFKALWTNEPFPWQAMLAERAAEADWPTLINLPTASGKTACLDAAVFGLAATAGRSVEERLPRRIWFVVDRRIVVDEAFERARAIASKLAEADEGPLKEVAEALRSLSGGRQPLAVARLRGGAWVSKGWARRPSQPAIVCSTVDQIGSALLFRAYGHSDETASIYAGLTAQDSLIVLDEAHCAVPFMQTLEAVARYRAAPWAERAIKAPFRYCIMSATPPEDVAEAAIFPAAAERAAALDHPLLEKRIEARKLAALEKPVKGDDERFASETAELILKFKSAGKLRIAAMVNRVAIAKNIAKKIAEELRKKVADAADVVLLTGRMRPLERDALVDRWTPILKAGATENPERPVIVVTTQCLEVGADFSFDALVTECASLDALRQRFGRLNRLGGPGESAAAILIRERDAKANADADPIYGKAIYETWTWLKESGEVEVDFGIAAMDQRVEALRAADLPRFKRLLAPWADAPVLLPAHLDLLCQTSPRPKPEPDVSLFLHGKGRSSPEVRVVFRADVKGEDSDIDVLSIVPPTSLEMLSVPLGRFKAWLSDRAADDTDGDVEGREEDDSADSGGPAVCRFAIWRGRERSVVTDEAKRIRPNDVVVLRASKEAMAELGQPIQDPDGLGPGRLDLAERAFTRARGRAVLRVHRDVLGPLRGHESIDELLALAESDPGRDEVEAALDAVLDEDDAAAFLAPWLKEIIVNLRKGARKNEHSDGGLILIGATRPGAFDADAEDDQFADEEDLRSQAGKPVLLREHTAAVAGFADEFAARCVEDVFREAIVAAAEAHDLGKVDWRFQLLLHGGDETKLSLGEPLAKSADLPERKGRRREIEEDARLKGFRHEFFSMQLAERFGLIPANDDARELALHLIASHHGYARPFAPPVVDKWVAEGRGGELCLNALGFECSLSAEERRDLRPAHSLDSGVAERFWKLTRRYGWWGLAYLEGVLRLSDWEASRMRGGPATSTSVQLGTGARSTPGHRIELDALDGANPLAFLAALGTLRLLTRALPECAPRLSWEQRLGAWRPVLWTAQPLEPARICEILIQRGLDIKTMFTGDLLAASVSVSPKNKKGEASWKDKLKFPVEHFREFCRMAGRSPSVLQEFAAAWAGETAPNVEDDKDLALRTGFDFTAGQQAFIGMLRELKETCTAADVQKSLFTGWRYSTGAVSMRWDTQDEKRQYALQASDPTKSENPPAADRGANFLAAESLPLFPMTPNRGADQAGFEGKGDGRSWTWPIWTPPMGLDAVRSLLTSPLVNRGGPWPPEARQHIGVSAVFQSRIVMPSGRYRCFTPARSV
ncbi:MAG TPA: type I-U CRISPR-associated helicase/endonuclease Cas3 [Bryobacteraceae bacterium]